MFVVSSSILIRLLSRELRACCFSIMEQTIPLTGPLASVTPLDVSESGNQATFRFTDEDHTLGCCLQYLLSRDPEIAFAGYSVPHPAERVINVRIQVRDVSKGTPLDCLARALGNLRGCCDILAHKVQAGLADYDKMKH